MTRTDEPRKYFSFDGLRSVVNLTDDSGTAAASYHLDAWGNYRFPSELTASKNRFGFTGYIYDEETKLWFAKARFYDPDTARFTTQDSYLGQADDPPSLHRYFYANDNPTRYVDPTGHAPASANDEQLSGALEEYRQIQAKRAAEAAQEKPGLFTRLAEKAKAGYRAVTNFVGITEEGPVAGGDPTDAAENEQVVNSLADDVAAKARAIEASKHKTLETAAKGAGIAKRVGEETISFTSATAGDAFTAATGQDVGTGEDVGTRGRVLAAIGVVIPLLGGKELRTGEQLLEDAEKAAQAETRLARTEAKAAKAVEEVASSRGASRKPFRELLNADELKQFEELKQKHPDFMPDVGAAARVLTPAEVKEARKRASRGGHHRHPLAFEGEPKPAEGLVSTGDTRRGKGPEHKEVTGFWNDVLRRLRNEEKK